MAQPTFTAVEQKGETRTQSVRMDSDLSAHQYKLVDFDASDEGIVNAVADANTASYVLIEGGDGSSTETQGTIAVGGVTKVILGGTVTQGDLLTATTGSVAIATTTDTDFYFGQAQTSGVSGDKISVLVIPGGQVSA